MLRHEEDLWKSFCVRRQWRTQKIFMGGFIQWHMVVICICCALFVTSQDDVVFMFPNLRFAKFVDIRCIFVYTHSFYFMCHWTEYKLSALQVRISEEKRCSRHVTVCTFPYAQQSNVPWNQKTARTESSSFPNKTWPVWRRTSCCCLATKNNWLKRTNPDQQEYAFFTVAKQQKQMMQTVRINQSRIYEIT